MKTKAEKKISKVMTEYGKGKLKSSSGGKVTNPKQAIAIALSEAKRKKKSRGSTPTSTPSVSASSARRPQARLLSG